MNGTVDRLKLVLLYICISLAMVLWIGDLSIIRLLNPWQWTPQWNDRQEATSKLASLLHQQASYQCPTYR
jgi:hypothetical protein